MGKVTFIVTDSTSNKKAFDVLSSLSATKPVNESVPMHSLECLTAHAPNDEDDDDIEWKTWRRKTMK